MKKFMLLVLGSCALTAIGQKLDFSLSAGTGKTYIFESLDKTVNVNYSLPMSLMTELKFAPANKTWGLKLRMLDLQSGLTGKNWLDNTPLNGYVSSMTTSFLLENEVQKRNTSVGLNFGMGMTRETLQPQQYDPSGRRIIIYPSVTLGAHLSYQINNDFDFEIQPVLLWQDPFKTIGVLTGARKANLAGEDLSAAVNFGIRYKLLR